MVPYKLKPARFAFYDREKIEKVLEAMSKKGWVLDKIGAYAWKYRADEPKERRVAVVYVAGASEFSPRPTESQELLRELGEADGWTLQTSWGQMQIYYSDNPDAVPMETDPVTQVESIRRAMKKNLLPAVGMNILIALMWLVILGWQLWTNPVYVLSTPIHLVLLPDAAIILLSALVDFVSAKLWYGRALAAAEQGQACSFHSPRLLTWTLNAIAMGLFLVVFLSFFERPAVLLLFFLPILLTWLLMSLLKNGLKKRGVSRRVNLLVTGGIGTIAAFVLIISVSLLAIHLGIMREGQPVGTFVKYGLERDVYDDDLPLNLEDLQDTGSMTYSREKTGHGSFLVSSYDYFQWPLTEDADWDSLDYTVTTVHRPAVYGLCKDHILRNRDEIRDGQVVFADHYDPIDAAPWGADEAYQAYRYDDYTDAYVLCYGSTLVELHLHEAPTAAQMQTVGEIFG